MAVDSTNTRRLTVGCLVQRIDRDRVVVEVGRGSTAVVAENEEPTSLVPIVAITSKKDQLWKIIHLSAIPASGVVIADLVGRFVSSASSNFESSIVAANANKESWGDLRLKVLGVRGEKSGTGSLLNKLESQAAAVVHTSIAHAESMTEAAVNSATYKCYMWASIIDSRTSDICMSRNGAIYNFGDGPLPPAHIRCGSAVMCGANSVS